MLACHVSTAIPLASFPDYGSNPTALFHMLRRNLTRSVADGFFLQEYRRLLLLYNEEIGKVVTIMFGNVTSVNLHVITLPESPSEGGGGSSSLGGEQSIAKSRVTPLVLMGIGVGLAVLLIVVVVFLVMMKRYSKHREKLRRADLLAWSEKCAAGATDTISKEEMEKWFAPPKSRSFLLSGVGTAMSWGPTDFTRATVGDKKKSFFIGFRNSDGTKRRWFHDSNNNKTSPVRVDAEFQHQGGTEDDVMQWLERPTREGSRKLSRQPSSFFGTEDFSYFFGKNDCEIFAGTGQVKMPERLSGSVNHLGSDGEIQESFINRIWRGFVSLSGGKGGRASGEDADFTRKRIDHLDGSTAAKVSDDVDFSYLTGRKDNEWFGGIGMKRPDRSVGSRRTADDDIEFSHAIGRNESEQFEGIGMKRPQKGAIATETEFSHTLGRKDSDSFIGTAARWMDLRRGRQGSRSPSTRDDTEFTHSVGRKSSGMFESAVTQWVERPTARQQSSTPFVEEKAVDWSLYETKRDAKKGLGGQEEGFQWMDNMKFRRPEGVGSAALNGRLIEEDKLQRVLSSGSCGTPSSALSGQLNLRAQAKLQRPHSNSTEAESAKYI